jgi:hypothetical protein
MQPPHRFTGHQLPQVIMTRNDTYHPGQSLDVFRADHLRVANGANLGDALGVADDMLRDDIYRLSPLARLERLSIRPAPASPFHIAGASETGQPGAALHLDCCVTFMSGTGETTECLVLVELDDTGCIAQIYALPLGTLEPRVDYALVGIHRDTALQRFAQIACVSFAAGTHITLASGAQRPVEDLRPGDRILTRDDGPQELRWIGHHTTRAVGHFAPVLIRAGTLNNENDLLVSPDFRLFIYQRRDTLGAGRPELLVRARHLVNGDTIRRVEGGFVDYHQMLFDSHQIIYAEGIAAESLLVDTRTSAILPDDLQDHLSQLIPGHSRSDHTDLEVQETLLSRPNTAELLRRSSIG